MRSSRPWHSASRPTIRPRSADSQRYVAQLLGLPAMQQWYAAALAETWRDVEHEEEVRAVGVWTEDLRAR